MDYTFVSFIFLGTGNMIHILGDQVIHTLPVVVIAISMIRHQRFARPQHGALALLGQLFFAYSQAGKMDLGEIYVSFFFFVFFFLFFFLCS